jgi:hypothetical protein
MGVFGLGELSASLLGFSARLGATGGFFMTI